MQIMKPKPVPSAMKSLGKRVEYQRERADLTVTALAARAGMTPGAISRIEDGSRVPGIKAATVLRLANALGCPVGWLIADEGDPGPVPVFREAGDRRRKSNRSESPE